MIEKSILGVAGEFAVAAELCRRNVYAQLTLGHRKRTDLLVVGGSGQMYQIEVKAKQGRVWPNCRGVGPGDSFLVFVDFERKSNTDRPTFYILTASDWHDVALTAMERYREKYPHRRAELGEDNVLVLPDEVNRYGNAYKGVGIKPEHIEEYREAWRKLLGLLGEAGC